MRFAESLKDKQVLVLGLGDTGYSAVRWLAAAGARVRVADTRSAPPHELKLRRDLPAVTLASGAFRAESFRGVDMIVSSPGVALTEPCVLEARSRGVEVVGDVELFARALKDSAANPRRRAPRVIGITGSNGKSTVTSMVGDMCRAVGHTTLVVGNIGLPVLDALTEAERRGHPDIYVLELSSFQLETTASLVLDTATVLNVSEDHMDRYPDIAAYATAKAAIFLHCGVQVLNQDDSYSRAMARRDRSVVRFGLSEPNGECMLGVSQVNGALWLADSERKLMPLEELRVTGLHNAANALAALALTRALDFPYLPLLGALKRFRGLAHRVEKVMQINGVTFYDDSKGTNVGATLAALKGMKQPVVLILGGEGKGQDFAPLNSAVERTHAPSFCSGATRSVSRARLAQAACCRCARATWRRRCA